MPTQSVCKRESGDRWRSIHIHPTLTGHHVVLAREGDSFSTVTHSLPSPRRVRARAPLLDSACCVRDLHTTCPGFTACSAPHHASLQHVYKSAQKLVLYNVGTTEGDGHEVMDGRGVSCR
jgi:hypothetical protein